jgi:hypothetical protein
MFSRENMVTVPGFSATRYLTRFSLEKRPFRLHNVCRFVTEEAATAIKPVRSRKTAGLLVTQDAVAHRS